MKKEVLRMTHIVTDDLVNTNLNDMNMHIFQGEIMGLIPINGLGIEKLIEVISTGSPVKFGRTYIDNKLVEEIPSNKHVQNKIYVISQKRKLVTNLSVLDNIYVLNSVSPKWFINRRQLERQFYWQAEKLNLNISPDTPCYKLKEYERCVVELFKAMTRGAKLIILYGLSDILNITDLQNLKLLLKALTKEQYSFLYICSSHEETVSFCDHTVYMQDGKDIKIFDNVELRGESHKRFMESFLIKPVQMITNCTAPNVYIRHRTTKNFDEFSFSVKTGECFVLYDEDMYIQKEFQQIMKENHGSLKLVYEINSTHPIVHSLEQCVGTKIAVIGEDPISSMIFYNMNYMDNLCFRMESKIKKINLSKKVKKNIQSELGNIFGPDIQTKSLASLSPSALYNLVYQRIYLLNPTAVFIVQPFYNADIYLKKHIVNLIHMLQKHQLPVIILSSDLSDSLTIANQVLVMKKRKNT